MKRISILMLFLASLFGNLHAQVPDTTEADVNIDSLYPPLDPNTLVAMPLPCVPPVLKTIAVVNYNGFAKASLRFDPNYAPTQIKIKKATEATSTTYNLTSTELLLTSLSPNSIYEIRATDNCTNEVVIGLVETSEGEKDALYVSKELFNALAEQKSGFSTTPLPTFLATKTAIDKYEILSFYQQFYNKGATLAANFSDNIADFPRGPRADCICKAILTDETALPSIETNFDLERFVQPDYLTKFEMNGDDADYWSALQNIGPAKYHQLWTEGRKADKGQIFGKDISFSDSTSMGPQQAILRLNFYCNDGQELPAACQCDKKVRFYYRYDTKITAHAHNYNGGWATKRSAAAVEDWALVVFKEEGNPNKVEIWNTVRAKAAAECSREVNPAFWTTGLDFLGKVAVIALPFAVPGGDSLALVNALKNIPGAFTALSTWINTPGHKSSTCNVDSETSATVEDNTLTSINPNTPVEVSIFSFDKLKAEGQRSWFSHARVLSDFYLGCKIDGGRAPEQPAHCCSPTVVTWILASCHGPMTEDLLKQRLGGIFATWTPGHFGLPQTSGGVWTLPHDSGYAWEFISDELCNRVEINPDYHSSDDGKLSEILQESISSDVKVFDVSGKMLSVLSKEDFWLTENGRLLLNLRGLNLPNGIYLAQFMQGKEQRTLKFSVFE